MSYYPYMNNYPYQNGMQYMQSQQPYTPQQQFLNGKIVDSADVVKATEVPIGGYGIFPKADLSEVYIKRWNNNGTASVITYKPYIEPVEEKQTSENSNSSAFSEILERINALEAKIDGLTQKSAERRVAK